MSGKHKTRISPQRLQEDVDCYLAIKALPNWQPLNPKVSLANMTAAYEALQASYEAELHIIHSLSAARDTVIANQWELREMVVIARNQAKAMYGEDSDEVVAMGLKKKSDRKSPKPKAKKPESGEKATE